MKLKDRVKIARDSLGKSQKDMSELLGINLKSWQTYEQGTSVPGGKVFESLVKLGFNANWLLTGEGDMRRGEGAPKQQETGLAKALCTFGAVDIPLQAHTNRESASPGADHSGDTTAMVAADPAAPFAQDPESEELCRLLKRYGNRALIEDFKAKLMKMKAVVEG